jgi:DNA-directed RNA polymerase specialized sigma24 family protein
MLEKLCKKDKLWRAIAYNICQDSMLADDIVQEMYLRFDRNPKDKVNDYYVALVLRSVYLNMLKANKEVSLTKFHYLEDTDNKFEPSDEEYEILLRAGDLTWVQQELLKEVYDRSYREIEKTYNINYGYVYKKVKEAREQILNNIKDEL